MRGDLTDEYYGTLSIKDLESLAKYGSLKEKKAARTQLNKYEAEEQLKTEEKLKKKELREAIEEKEKNEKKKEKTLRVIKNINRVISIKDFTTKTGMVPSTARRELGQAEKRGDIVRVNKDGSIAKPGARTGLYRFK